MLAVGIIPALYVVKLRRQMLETPRYALQVEHDQFGATSATERILGARDTPSGAQLAKIKKESHKEKVNSTKYASTLNKYIIFVIGTSITWFIFDMAFYGTTLNNSFILENIGYSTKVATHTAVFNIAVGDSILAGLFAVPGYFIAVALVDGVGRKTLQWIGFLVMALSYFITGSGTPCGCPCWVALNYHISFTVFLENNACCGNNSSALCG